MIPCSKCPEESVVWFGLSEWKTDIPLCYLHLKEARIITDDKSTINITISHDAYEAIKDTFKKYRGKAGMQYARSLSYETDSSFHHEWHGSEDFLSIDFGYDKSKSTSDNPSIIDAQIHYTFSKQSTIAGNVYAMLLRLDNNTKIQSHNKSSQIIISDNRDMLKTNFLSSIHPEMYSEDFIKNTLGCIDQGILTQISSLHPLPFSNVSRFKTKGEIPKSETSTDEEKEEKE